MNTPGKIKAVLRRELRLMRQRPVYLIASVGVMAFCMIFFLTLLRDRIPHDLPIGVVDLDGTSLSRNLVRQMDATRIGRTVSFTSYTQARQAMQTGKISAFCIIPEHFYDDVLAFRQPVLTFYVNTLYFVGGALSYKDLLTLANLSSGAVQRELLRARGMDEQSIMAQIQPIVTEAHNIGNPAADYRAFLCGALIPGVLETITILVTVYALGSELKYGTSRHLLEKAGGSMSAAVAGKLIPYTVLFTSLGIISTVIMYVFMGFPFAGSLWHMFAGILAMVLASEAVAVFIIGTLPVLRLAISISALYSMLAFSLTGFSLPVEAMPSCFQGLAAAFPLRHYYLMYASEGIFDAGFSGWYMHLAAMLLFLFLPATVLKRLHGAYMNLNFPRK